MRIRNGVWRRIQPEFSSAQRDIISLAARQDNDSLNINESTLPAWLRDKLQAAVSQIEVGA